MKCRECDNMYTFSDWGLYCGMNCHVKHMNENKWDNCEDCGLFRQMNLGFRKKLVCWDCFKRTVEEVIDENL